MINADRLIKNIDEFNAVCAKNEMEQSKTAVERFDLAIKVIESHRADIENAGKVLTHWSMRVFPIKIYRPHMYDDQPQHVALKYDKLDGGRLRCGYVTAGLGPDIGWLSDGTIQIGYNWSMTIDDVRNGILHGLNDKVVDGEDISYQQVVNALSKLATLYPEAEKDFVYYFESLGR